MTDDGSPDPTDSVKGAAARAAMAIEAFQAKAVPRALWDAEIAAKFQPLVMPPIPEFHIPVDGNLASEFYNRLTDWIQRFDAGLDNEHEVGVRLVTFGQALTFHLDHLGYWNPSLISFCGTTEQGDPVELIQHVSQISILLLKMKRADPSKPKKPIGFCMPEEDGAGQTGQALP